MDETALPSQVLTVVHTGGTFQWPKRAKKGKEADSGTSNAQALRAAPPARKRESVRIRSRTHLSESDSPPAKAPGSKYEVVLIEEGLGNFNDRFFYTKECLQASAAIFEGRKCFADHATEFEEQVQPERSTRDILGHFEGVHYVEEGGRGKLKGTLVLCEGAHFEWAQSLIQNSMAYAQKYPSSDFVGLSINAQGEALTVGLDDFLKVYDGPREVVAKLMEAQAQQIDEIRPVGVLRDAQSCDLVTEAGAGGKILSMIERNKRPMKATQTGKAGKASKHTETTGKKKVRESEDAPPPKKTEAEGEAAGGGDDGHADADQDAALFKKMISQYMGDDHGVDQEEAEGMARVAHEHFMKQGMESHEAYEAAGMHLKNSLAIGKSMKQKQAEAEGESHKSESESESESHHEAEGESHCESEDPSTMSAGKKTKATESAGRNPVREDDSFMKEELVRLRADNTKLRESVGRLEVQTYLDKKLAAAGEERSPEFLKAFRESLGKPKSIAEIEHHWGVFVKAYDTGREDQGSDDEAIFTEKGAGFRESSGSKAVDFTDCLDS